MDWSTVTAGKGVLDSGRYGAPLCCWACRSEASDTRGFRLTSGVELSEKGGTDVIIYRNQATIKQISMLFTADVEYSSSKVKLRAPQLGWGKSKDVRLKSFFKFKVS